MSLSINVTGPLRDVHSGNDGGVFNEPMTDLIKIMGTVLAPGESTVMVRGRRAGREGRLRGRAQPCRHVLLKACYTHLCTIS